MDKPLYGAASLSAEFYDAAKKKLVTKPRPGQNKGGEKSMVWLITFTDIMGLMLTFFVLMFSMSEPRQEDFSDLMGAMNTEFNSFYGRAMNAGPEDSIDVARIDFDRALDIPYLEALIESVINRNDDLRERAATFPQGDHLIVSLPQDLLFSVGDATLKEGSARMLFSLGGAFSRMKNAIEFVGHADPRAIESNKQSPYQSNWALSLARAVHVAAALDRVGYTQPVTVRGASSGRYQDLGRIVDENRRLDLSRRVDIDILNHDGRRKKVFTDPPLP